MSPERTIRQRSMSLCRRRAICICGLWNLYHLKPGIVLSILVLFLMSIFYSHLNICITDITSAETSHNECHIIFMCYLYFYVQQKRNVYLQTLCKNLFEIMKLLFQWASYFKIRISLSIFLIYRILRCGQSVLSIDEGSKSDVMPPYVPSSPNPETSQRSIWCSP